MPFEILVEIFSQGKELEEGKERRKKGKKERREKERE